MDNQYVKKTFGAENKVRLAFLGSSITGAWSFNTRFKNYMQTVINHYKARGFYVDALDLTINGGTLYNSVSTTFTYPTWYVGTQARLAGRTIDDALTWGATHCFILFDYNDTDQGHVGANIEGLNVYGEEQIDLFQQYFDFCIVNNMVPIGSTTSTHLNNETKKNNLKTVADNMKAVWDLSGQMYLDLFYTIADSNNEYYGRAVDYFDSVHLNLDDGSGIGHGRVANVLYTQLNSLFNLTAPVYELINDKYETETACITVNPNGDFNFPDFNGLDFKV